MEKPIDLKGAAGALKTRIDLKRFLREHCELSHAEAATVVREISNDNSPDETPDEDEDGPRTRLARKMLNADNREKDALSAVTFLNSEWVPEGRYWEMTRYVKTPEDEALKAKEVERGRALFEEVKATEDDDALYALLLRRGWKDVDIALYLKKFGHSEAALKAYGARQKEILASER